MSRNSTNLITGNTKILRGINRAMLLNIIREKQPISRIKLARITGLNKSTVSSIISELLQEDLIFEQVNEDQNVGRNPINLFLKLGKYYVGAINIDSSITRFAVVDIDGSVKGISAIETKSKEPEGFVKICIDELKRLCEELEIKHIEGLGVSIAGIVDSENLTVNFAPNLGWEDFNIGKFLKENLPEIKNISVGNDAKSSALAELRFGSYDFDLSNFVFLSIGQGIGSGIVIENKIMNGEFNASGEFGHMVIFEGGQLCTCGNNGCWEAYASDRAIVNRYLAKKHGKAYHAVDFIAQDIIDLAKKNDEAAVDIIKQIGCYLGLGIASIIKAIDPHAIIIGGKITQVWDIIYPEINSIVLQRSFFGKKKDIKILPTSINSLSPRLMGAAALAIEEIFSGYKIMS
jgi:predicted NBD/HSP70 family sugar kinase